MRRTIVRLLMGGGVCLTLAFGIFTLTTPTQAAPGCICPMVYSPVKCSNGKTYSNLCVANCARATGCVSIWTPPPPIE